ncbi:hypothetical protein B296_00058817 [Ensete ventricosum]|uniref:Uncharacterized protein n=1 Tax=Ensete ventricosum TaxID=4639 RepID=A0A426XKB6_ENSVE|nr:hypothetical protein B296_00058817 [Ensete ventricosum]
MPSTTAASSSPIATSSPPTASNRTHLTVTSVIAKTHVAVNCAFRFATTIIDYRLSRSSHLLPLLLAPSTPTFVAPSQASATPSPRYCRLRNLLGDAASDRKPPPSATFDTPIIGSATRWLPHSSVLPLPSFPLHLQHIKTSLFWRFASSYSKTHLLL